MSTPTRGELSCDECNARTAALTAERDQLRSELERFTGHGLLDCHAICDQRDAAIARAERAKAERDALAKDKARLDSGQILLTVSGERVWHSGVDLRAAIDAAITPAAALEIPARSE